MALPKFASTRSFHTELRTRINQYFEESGKQMTGDFRIVLKAVLLVTAFVGLYIHVVFFTPPLAWALLECALFGAVGAGIGFNVMHDGAHGSFSEYRWLNKVAAFTLNVMGGSTYMWNAKHNLIHHTYTNIDGHDDDIDIQPWMRMTADQPRYRLHRFQHLYFWFLYCMLYISWIFVMDYQKYFSRKIGSMGLKDMTLSDHLVFWGFKALNLVLFVGLPLYIFGFWGWLAGFMISMMVTGFVLSIVFQLAHTVEDAAFPVPHATTGKLEDEWAIHQVRTTANFATNSKLVSWFVGGLNFQIEHHLFPKISHVHYPEISKIVQQVCDEFNIKYNNYRHTRTAIASHVAFLRQMGQAA
ncbi:acyl-CoA desaturase [Hymenobacter saemangeumensis]|uniref:Acyl-CoA desaturase n=1 Tax=Hymenobacter saemangeumensis TaxID=1084522 RepID=A0ABP8ITB0_9BACT